MKILHLNGEFKISTDVANKILSQIFTGVNKEGYDLLCNIRDRKIDNCIVNTVNGLFEVAVKDRKDSISFDIFYINIGRVVTQYDLQESELSEIFVFLKSLHDIYFS